MLAGCGLYPGQDWVKSVQLTGCGQYPGQEWVKYLLPLVSCMLFVPWARCDVTEVQSAGVTCFNYIDTGALNVLVSLSFSLVVCTSVLLSY